MKTLLKLLVFSLLTLTMVLAGSGYLLQNHQNSFANNVPEQNSPISVSLPNKAEVILKNGGSMSGRLTAIDSQKQEMNLELGNESTSVAILDIEKVEFTGEVILRCGDSDCKIVIRGDEDEKSPDTNRQIWSEPLNNFRVIDPITGEAQIKLISIPENILKGIRAVALRSSYVVDEIQFDSLEVITLKVTPHNSK